MYEGGGQGKREVGDEGGWGVGEGSGGRRRGEREKKRWEREKIWREREGGKKMKFCAF